MSLHVGPLPKGNPTARARTASQQATTTERDRRTAESDPERWAVRLGFDSLDHVRDGFPERLRGYVERVMSNGRWLAQLEATAQVTDRNGNRTTARAEQLMPWLIERAESADRVAIHTAEARAASDRRHTCSLMGVVDATTRTRTLPWGREQARLSDRGHAALIRAWLETVSDADLAAARAHIAADHGPTQPPPPPKRRRTSG